jgi:hypothetical protein
MAAWSGRPDHSAGTRAARPRISTLLQWPIASHQEISTSHYPLGIALRTLATGLLSPQTIFRGEQCTTGAFAHAPTKARRSGGVVADIAKRAALSVARKLAREAYHTLRELGDQALVPADLPTAA